MNSRTLLIVAAVLAAVWFLMHHGKRPQPWNVGQAGTIFSGLHGGGGQ